MRNDAFLVQNLARIYHAARESEDGQRCMVAPHPDLQARLRNQLQSMRSITSAAGLPSTMLRFIEPRRLGFNDGTIRPPSSLPPGFDASLVRSASPLRSSLRGVLRVIVVLVDFEDQPMTATLAHFQDLFFSQGGAAKSVRDYYAEVTHGLVDIQGTVVGPFHLQRNLSGYANGQSGMGSASPNAQTMAKDALTAATASVGDFSQYDNDGDGFVDAFIVVHAGPGAEVTGNANQIWSHKWIVESGPISIGAVKVYGYLTVPEDAKIGVCCHELGHLLFGFPDLYDTTNVSEGIGNWCLMAGGSWGGGGDLPVHPCAWCKINQGWATPYIVSHDGPLTIDDVKKSFSVLRLWADGTSGNEYFLLENRQQTGFDASLPGSGLLIWHIDDSVPDNNSSAHYKVALLQADGLRDLELANNRGDQGDPFPGGSNNRACSATTTPNTNSYSHADTHVRIIDISDSGPTMTANVSVTSGGARVVANVGDWFTRTEDRLAAIEKRLASMSWGH